MNERNGLTLVGFLFTMVAGQLIVSRVLRYMRRTNPIPSISPDPQIQGQWEELIRHPDANGNWVGNCERIVFFVVLFLGEWQAVGVWLAFKVAAKWEAWSHMAFVPDDFAKADPVLYAIARRRWAAQGYGTFVVGTVLNGILAGAGVLIAKYAEW